MSPILNRFRNSQKRGQSLFPRDGRKDIKSLKVYKARAAGKLYLSQKHEEKTLSIRNIRSIGGNKNTFCAENSVYRIQVTVILGGP